jgi:hypothetical protein
MSPCVAEDLTLIVELSSQIVAEISQSILEFFLELIEDVVDIVHGLNRLFFVLLNLTIKED